LAPVSRLSRRPILAMRYLRPRLGAGEDVQLNWRDPWPSLVWLASAPATACTRSRNAWPRRHGREQAGS
jgi:hypothetical protein